MVCADEGVQEFVPFNNAFAGDWFNGSGQSGAVSMMSGGGPAASGVSARRCCAEGPLLVRNPIGHGRKSQAKQWTNFKYNHPAHFFSNNSV
jgi:hypothetical protein